MRGTLPLLLILAASFGCQSKKSEAIVAAPISPAAGAMPAAATGGITGKVLERIEAAPYCYLRLETARGEVWVAVPEAKIEKGTEVTVVNPMLMANFESKTLKRTFAEVYFGNLGPAGGAAPAAPATPAAAPGAAPMGTPPPVPMEVGKIDKATGADAHTIAEVWSQKGKLKEKAVTIRGKVVKYNPGVMGKNWIHLQDGSG